MRTVTTYTSKVLISEFKHFRTSESLHFSSTVAKKVDVPGLKGWQLKKGFKNTEFNKINCSYNGGWSEGQRNGRGVTICRNGDIYSGSYQVKS